MQQSIQLRGCRFDFDHEHARCSTIFPDGKVVPACPEDTEEYRATAVRLGYGPHTIQMCFDHELIHTLMAEAIGLNVSPVLRHVADGGSSLSDQEIWDEEDRVMALQKMLMQVRCRR